MNIDLLKGAFRALWKNRWLIIAVTVLAGAVSVGKELLFPAGYSADTILMVTGLSNTEKSESTSGTTEMLPTPLSPKAYEQMLKSSTVLGKTLAQLVKDGAFPPGEEPLLDDFMEMVQVHIDIIDETSRPVNYSPLIRLTALAETAELAGQIIDTWSGVAVTQAQRSATVKVGGPALALNEEKAGYETALEEVWKEMSTETALWNIEVLKAELDSRVALLNTYLEKSIDAERKFEVATEKLALIRGDVAALVQAESAKFETESQGLRDRLKEEMSQANVELMLQEMGHLLELNTQLQKERLELERTMGGYEQKLATVRASLEKEKPLLELGRSPSETAYWISGAENPKTMDTLTGKMMVSQEINPVYQDLKKSEYEVSEALSQGKAELESVVLQIGENDKRMEALRAAFGGHKMMQGALTTTLETAEGRYKKIGADERLTLLQLEREALLEMKGAEVEKTALNRQIEQLRREQADLQADLAEHTMIQTRLKTREEIASKIFTDIATTESSATAAFKLASGQGTDRDKTVGLNRLTTETYPVQDKGLLGKKGRVLAATLLAFALVCSLAYAKDEGVPRLRAFMAELR